MDIYNSRPLKLPKLKRLGIILRNIFLICTAIVVPAILFAKNIKQIFSSEGHEIYVTVMAVIFVIGFLSFLIWMVLLIYKLLSNPSRRRTVGIILLALWAICTAVVALALIFDRNIRAVLTYSAYGKIGNVFGPLFIVGFFSFFAWILLLGNKLVRIVVGVLAVTVVIFFSLIGLNKVVGNQMGPALYDKSYILTNKLFYRFNSPKRGDIIIYMIPLRKEFIGRVVGLPGEEITVTRGSVKINGGLLQEPYANWTKYITLEPTTFKLNSDEYWAPFDSRLYPVRIINKKDIKGKVFYLYWPLSRKGPIK